jgi:putative holliday junction resolvase
MRILAIDYGAKRIGLALGDTVTRIPTPWGILDRKDDAQAIEEILKTARREGAEIVVVGLPHSPRNPEAFSEQRAEIERFVESLRASADGIDIQTEDETLTSVLGDRLARDAGRHGDFSDDLAASAILTTWLSRKR